jgi:hypothetical protein
MITEIIFLLTISIATAYALYEDRNGDVHPNKDWIMVLIVMAVCSIIVAMFDNRMSFLMDFVRSMFMAVGIYALLFDYLIVIVHKVRRVIELKPGEKWYNRMSDTAIPDKWDWWRAMHWYGRLFARIWVFSICVIVYFCPCKIQHYTNQCFICQ